MVRLLTIMFTTRVRTRKSNRVGCHHDSLCDVVVGRRKERFNSRVGSIFLGVPIPSGCGGRSLDMGMVCASRGGLSGGRRRVSRFVEGGNVTDHVMKH